MRYIAPKDAAELDATETREWLDSLDYVLQSGGPAKVARLLRELTIHARQNGVKLPFTANTPYINTISADEQALMPGSPDLERRIKSLVRWNAAAMVVRANKAEEGIGGHISTFASAATLYEVGFNHFFRGRSEGESANDGDVIFFQGHAAPGIYARAYLEGRIDETHLENFRRETKAGGGLSSYPHPWLMPDFWEYPTVSMGLGPLMAIYQARFMRYLEDRGLKPHSQREGLGVPRRRRDRRARSARRDHAAGARKARQPDLRRQLQPAAARRPGARQRPDHPGARSGVPRRRLERDQGDLGPRVGSAARQGSRRPAGQAHGRDRRRPVSEVRRRIGRLRPRAFLGRRSAAARHGQAPVRRPAEEDDARRPRSGEGLQRLQGRGRAQGRTDRRSSRGRSRATASAKPAKARTSPTSRRR